MQKEIKQKYPLDYPGIEIVIITNSYMHSEELEG